MANRQMKRCSKSPINKEMQIKTTVRASLVAQWSKVCMPTQGHRFNPWSRKIPHAVEQLSPCTTTTDPVCPS